MSEEKQMSFLDHLEELRWRLVRSSISVVLIAGVLFYFQEWIIETVFLSMRDPNFITFRLFCDYFNVCVEEIPVSFQSTTMAGQFTYAMMTSIMGGIVLSFPFIFYQLWAFVKPGLRQNEQSVAKGIVFWVSLLFFLGILFGYYIVAPLTVQFFGAYQISGQIENIFTISSYMSTILSTVFYSGLLFLLPVISYLFAKLGIITPEFLRKYRKHAIVGVLIIAAVITPPDVISQIIVSIPILALYEVGILVVARVDKNRKKQETQ
ncbi:MAG: twin-arginine translocase subunit TatC [Flavobacteriia bacterium]|jgi:sec-independent protein translocase protein TatC